MLRPYREVFSFCLWIFCASESESFVPDLGGEPRSIVAGRAQAAAVGKTVVPGAAPYDLVFLSIMGVEFPVVRVGLVPVYRPFLDVAGHIVQSVGTLAVIKAADRHRIRILV